MDYNGQYVIWGPPGCGKTTFLGKQVRSIVDGGGVPCLCSLTRTAAAEMAGREMPIASQQIGTLHSHAYRMLGAGEVAEGRLKEWNEANPNYSIADENRHDKDEPATEWSPKGEGDELYRWYNVYRARKTPVESWPTTVRAFARVWDDWKKQTDSIDFTDMIELAVTDTEHAPGDPNVLIADEAQDLSSLEFDLLKHWGDRAGALMIAGDPWQSLYVWRGAHPEAFTDPSIPKDRVRILSQSYRVPIAVQSVAMQFARDHLSDFSEIEYKPRPEEGSVTKLNQATWKRPERIVEAAIAAVEAGKTAMICSACSYMLAPTLAILRKEGVPFSNPWRKKRGDWNPLRSGRGVSAKERVLALLRPDTATWGRDKRFWQIEDTKRFVDVMNSRGWLIRGAKKMLDSWNAENPTGAMDFDKFRQLMPIDDLTALFDASDGIGEGTRLELLTQWLHMRLLEAKRRVMEYPIEVATRRGGGALIEYPRLFVGTIHSFKGAEADEVFVIPDVSPSGYQAWIGDPEEKDSVTRQFYVALTRARERVHITGRVSGMSINLRGYAA